MEKGAAFKVKATTGFNQSVCFRLYITTLPTNMTSAQADRITSSTHVEPSPASTSIWCARSIKTMFGKYSSRPIREKRSLYTKSIGENLKKKKAGMTMSEASITVFVINPSEMTSRFAGLQPMIKAHAAIKTSVVMNVSALFPSKMSSVFAGDNISPRSVFFSFSSAIKAQWTNVSTRLIEILMTKYVTSILSPPNYE